MEIYEILIAKDFTHLVEPPKKIKLNSVACSPQANYTD
jgi:hypothetical protein